ncbi:MAG: tyrosine--tRNA ligase [SAR116 cluster bacterium]|nr:MAG: tyrosine--tRNA ligase [SAR116 cluster bacterium]|tara:strand:- start:1163 stop:2410 length:1248 start_codon:yes stop_codon:yes gene_type:complete
MTYKSALIQQFTERGYMHQATNLEGLDETAEQQIVPTYIGFDCTADSLHVGSLVQIMMLRIIQKSGHKPIVLMGGGTTKVGDPSGKDTARPLLSDQDIEHNKQGIKSVFEKYLTFGDGPTDAVMVDNANWLDNLAYVRFLRDYGPHFSINRMMSMESVKLRLEREQPLSFLEFNYAILQAYDFLELRRRYGCLLQLGGSDQWGNIVSGIDLTRRVDAQEIFGLTSPLITTASGAKMGKSADGAVWLNAEKLSPFHFWQFWRNTEDADVGRFLALFTELSMDEVNRLAALQGAEINEAKIILANEATILCHGADAAREAMQTAQQTFVSGGGVSDGLPQTEIHADEANGMEMIAALNKVGFATSNGEARRLIRGGGARLNDAQINDEAKTLSPDDFIDGKAKISAGKKRHALLVLV